MYLKYSFFIFLITLVAQLSYAQNSNQEWQSQFELGFSSTQGNSDTISINSKISSKKEYGVNDKYVNWWISYFYNNQDDVVSNNEVSAAINWQERLHNYPMFSIGLISSFRHDEIADIAYKVDVTPIIKASIITSDYFKLDAETGFGFTIQRLGSDNDAFAHWYIGESTTYKVSDISDIYQHFAFYLPLQDSARSYYFRLEVGITTKMTTATSLKVAIENNFEAQPASGRRRNDFKLITSLVYKF